MGSPEAYLRDVPRVCMKLSQREVTILRDRLSRLSEPGSETYHAEARLLHPRQQADELQKSIEAGWNKLTNTELWTAFYALLVERRLYEDLWDRVSAATVPMERMDAAAKKGSNRGPNWENERQFALDRDGNQCAKCGDSDSKLHVHHRVKFRRHNTPEGANRPDNLVSLCPACHASAEFSDRA